MDVVAEELDRLASGAALANKYAHDHSFWVKLGHSIVKSAKDGLHFDEELVKGFGSATVGLVKLAWEVSSIHEMVDPVGYAKDMDNLAKGFASLGSGLIHNPGSTLYKMFDINDLEHNPGRWIGQQLPGIAIGILTGGAGFAASAAADGTTAVTEDVVIDASADAVDSTTTDAAKEATRAAEDSLTTLPKSATIKLGNYTYKTDELGRVVEVSGQLKKLTGSRLSQKIAAQARGLGNPGDHAGHIIARRFDGPNDLVNVLPQDANFNMGAWKSVENGWAKALENDQAVDVRISMKYVGNSTRPKTWTAETKIEGVKSGQVRMYNAPGGLAP